MEQETQLKKQMQTTIRSLIPFYNDAELNKGKVKFRQTEIPYLGHLVTSNGLKPDPDKVRQYKRCRNQTMSREYEDSVDFSPS